jgi:hypothetical protein
MFVFDRAVDLVDFVLVLQGQDRPLLLSEWLQRLLLLALGKLTFCWVDGCMLVEYLRLESHRLVEWFVLCLS